MVQQDASTIVFITPTTVPEYFSYEIPYVSKEGVRTDLKPEDLAKNGKSVLKGKFQGKIDVALKIYRNSSDNQNCKERLMVQRDLEVLQAPQHINEYFIRYFGSVDDGQFTYVATEWCEWCLVDVVEGKIKFNLTNKEILRQMAEAVNFVHSLGFIHRNLSPENFRIARITGSKDVVKLTDFRFCRSFTHANNAANSGTINIKGWTAPECLVIGIILLPQVDVFILGCLFFYVFTRGQHPFGDHPFQRTSNMKKSSKEWIELKSDKLSLQELDLIRPMISRSPSKRPTMADVLADDYFKPSSEIYPMYSADKPAGLCIVISQELFIMAKHDRPGSEVDAQLLWDTFLGFGFDVQLYKNLQSDQLIRLMKEVATRKLEDYPSLIVCMLSHGNKGTVMGTDLVEVSLNQLMYTFNGHDCTALIDKPKIFIIQACQGDYTQPAIDQTSQAPSINMNVFPTHDRVEPQYRPEGKLREAMMGFQPDNSHPFPPVIDFLQLKSSVDEFISFRNPTIGSRFIQLLCSALKKEYSAHGSGKPVRPLVQVFQEDVIGKVSEGDCTVSQRPGQKFKQTPEYRSSLRKNVSFRIISSSHNKQSSKFIETKVDVQHDNISEEEFKKQRKAYDDLEKLLKESE